MTQARTIECDFHFSRAKKGRKELRLGADERPVVETGRVPRVSRLMALAIRFDQLLRDGVVKDYAELAQLGHVTRARITQIMNLLLLAPDVQEELLFLPRVEQGRDPICLRDLQAIALEPDWLQQRMAWRRVGCLRSNSNL